MPLKVQNPEEMIEFSSESLEVTAQLLSHLKSNDSLSYNWILERLHYLKGNTAVAGFADLSDFIHMLEELCRIASNKAFAQDFIRKELNKSVQYLNTSYQQIQKLETYQNPKPFYEKIQSLVASADWIAKKESVSNSNISISQPAKTTISNTDVNDSLSQQTLRVQREDLDFIQKELKSLQQIRTKLSLFSKQLKSEFQGEPFLRDLDALVGSLNTPLVQVGEVFFKFRAKSFAMLTPKLEKITQETATTLGKNINIFFDFQTEFLLDQQILSVLDVCFSHLIKNSIDHGIEKSGTVTIEMSVENQSLSTQDMLTFRLHDDGKGLNIDSIKQKIIDMNILSKSAIEKMSRTQIADFIFLPQLSTKTEVSKISGRGVGMSLIKSELEKVTGSIRVVPVEKGTCFEIKVPRCFEL